MWAASCVRVAITLLTNSLLCLSPPPWPRFCPARRGLNQINADVRFRGTPSSLEFWLALTKRMDLKTLVAGIPAVGDKLADMCVVGGWGVGGVGGGCGGGGMRAHALELADPGTRVGRAAVQHSVALLPIPLATWLHDFSTARSAPPTIHDPLHPHSRAGCPRRCIWSCASTSTSIRSRRERVPPCALHLSWAWSCRAG